MNTLKKVTLLILIPSFTWAHQNIEKNVIKVTGECEKSIETDRVKLNFRIEALDKNQKNSSNTANRKYKNLLREIKALNLANYQASTDSYNVNPQNEWVKSKKIFKGYKTSISLSVITSQKEKTGTMIEIANKLRISNITGPISFISTQKYQKNYLECLETASSDAKKKASILAKSFNVSLGKVSNVSARPSNNQKPPVLMRSKISMMSDSSSAPEIKFSKTNIFLKLDTSFNIK